MRCYYFLLFFFLFQSESNAQTCILFAKGDNVIYLAADSRTTGNINMIINGKVSYKDSIYKTCKIQKERNVYIAIAGIANEETYQLAKQCIIDGIYVDLI